MEGVLARNVVGFLVQVVPCAVLYLREVDAPAAQKAFVFSLVTLFGFFATLTSSNASYLMGFAEQSDGYMYYPPRPVVLSTARHAMSFLPGEVSYVDSLNRVRAIHFANGERVEIDMTLAAIFEVLPADRFAYCHRSVVVNLGHVRGLSSERLVLDDGTALPVSRRRYVEVRDALEAR